LRYVFASQWESGPAGKQIDFDTHQRMLLLLLLLLLQALR
jgi:hypothetical protein